MKEVPFPFEKGISPTLKHAELRISKTASANIRLLRARKVVTVDQLASIQIIPVGGKIAVGEPVRTDGITVRPCDAPTIFRNRWVGDGAVDDRVLRVFPKTLIEIRRVDPKIRIPFENSAKLAQKAEAGASLDVEFGGCVSALGNRPEEGLHEPKPLRV